MKECSSLEEVRQEIDEIDEKIVEFMAKRNNLIRQAVKFKQSVEEVKAQDRIDEVIQHVRTKAVELGMSANMVTDIYTKMIDEMVEIEIAQFRDRGSL